MTDTREFLQELMGRYTTDNVEDPVAFKAKIDEFLAMEDWKMEGYTEAEKDVQRKKSIRFQWGHNHDFGSFKLDGLMGDRHINILATFIDDFGLPKDLTGKSVLDVGVWCGGTSLLLAAMGARVTALEEVVKYADCARFLSFAFGLIKKDPPAMFVYSDSIYDMDEISQPNCQNYFDYIIFPGVLYHLSDPILALRILFNAIKDGGELYLETAVCDFSNPENCRINFANGKGNNIFIPSYPAVASMMEYVGFKLESCGDIMIMNGRGYLHGIRTEWKPMLKAGLSRRVR